MKSNSRKEWMLRILSLVFAVLLWAYVRGETNILQTKTLRNINVVYEGMDDLKQRGFVIISPKEAKVNVTVEAYSNTMPYARDSISAKIDLSDYSAGEFSLPIDVSSIQSDIKIKAFDPATIPVKIDKRASQAFMANIVVKGKPATNFSLGDIKKQERVSVSGPSTFMNQVEKVEAAIDVTNLKKTDYLKAEMIAYDSKGEQVENLTIEPSTVQIEVPILKVKTVPIKLNIIGDIPENINIEYFSAEPKTVTIRGNSDVIDSVDYITAKEITLDNIRQGTNDLSLNLPENVSLVDPKVKFKVNDNLGQLISNGKILSIDDPKVNLLNEDEKYSYKMNYDGPILIKYKGQTDRELEASEVLLNINLNEVTESGEFPIEVSLPLGFELLSLSPETIDIEVKEK